MTAYLVGHIWQSTLFVGVAALLTLLLRGNQARARYYIWLAASLKFLVPLAAMVAVGRRFAWLPAGGPSALQDTARAAAETLTTPFLAPGFEPVAGAALSVSHQAVESALRWPGVSTLLATAWITGALCVLAVWALRWRKVRTELRVARPVTHGRELDILRRTERTTGSRALRLLVSSGSLEPGVVGCVRPVMLWPAAISDRMSDRQIEAIMLHELAHVRRRDNLLGLLHMFVQAVFWFHPLVWWIGARLVHERERACDEDVIRHGVDPHQYAESILRTCEYVMASPLVCVAGITGSDLKRRVVTIVNSRPAPRLSTFKVALLTSIGLVVAVGPLAAGALSRTIEDLSEAIEVEQPDNPMDVAEPTHDRTEPVNPPADTLQPIVGVSDELAAVPTPDQTAAAGAPPARLKFDVASIKLVRNPAGPSAAAIAPAGRPLSRFNHGGSIRALLQRAYGIPYVQQVGGPEWIREDTYIIAATIPEGVEGTPDNINAMIRALLADRFRFAAREETRELPVYELVHARGDKTLGPNLTPVAPECLLPDNKCGQRLSSARGSIEVRNSPLQRLAATLEFAVSRPVIDRTGLTERYDVSLKYAEDGLIATGVSELPSLFTALQEQLGLKLESTRGPVNVLVIDGIARPTED